MVSYFDAAALSNGNPYESWRGFHNLRVMRLPAIFLLLLTLSACSKPLYKRVPGTWLIDHYDEYTAGRSTGHLMDTAGYIAFFKNQRGTKKFISGRPHGALGRFQTFDWCITDSLVTITSADGQHTELWLITSKYPTYQEWVSVNAARDTVRTMYLMKR